jgi:hypothetical protein
LAPEKKLAAVPLVPLPLPTDAPANEPEKEEVEEEDDDDNWYNEQYPVSVILRCIQLMQLLKNVDDLERIVKLSAALALPADEAAELTRKIEAGEVRVPSRRTIHKAAIKLDYTSMLYQRQLFKQALLANTKWSSQFGGDSSPQVTFDYMIQTNRSLTNWKLNKIGKTKVHNSRAPYVSSARPVDHVC